MYPVRSFILNESAIWLLNKESHKSKYICRNSPRRTCRPCGFTMKISYTGHRHLMHIVKRNTKTVGIGPFKIWTGLG